MDAQATTTTPANFPVTSVAGAQGGLWLPACSLARREVVRFLRQRSRVIGALGMPIMFWLLIGAGMGRSFRTGGASDAGFLEYFFPGIVVLTVMFSAIYSTISIIEDRTSGFMQSVLVAPVPRSSIILGKVIGGTVLSLLQGGLLLMLSRAAGIHMTVAGFVFVLMWLTMISVALTGLGCILAWMMDSMQGFHAVMNLLLMPIWLLSGAFFPGEGAHFLVKWVMMFNPLTYGMAGVRKAMYFGTDTEIGNLPPTALCILITLAFGAVTFWYSTYLASRKET